MAAALAGPCSRGAADQARGVEALVDEGHHRWRSSGSAAVLGRGRTDARIASRPLMSMVKAFERRPRRGATLAVTARGSCAREPGGDGARRWRARVMPHPRGHPRLHGRVRSGRGRQRCRCVRGAVDTGEVSTDGADGASPSRATSTTAPTSSPTGGLADGHPIHGASASPRRADRPIQPPSRRGDWERRRPRARSAAGVAPLARVPRALLALWRHLPVAVERDGPRRLAPRPARRCAVVDHSRLIGSRCKPRPQGSGGRCSRHTDGVASRRPR
jgi:hypothetical protein